MLQNSTAYASFMYLLCIQGQQDRERRSLPNHALCADASLVGIDNVFDNGQA
jgi:hypothetical protein